MIDDRRALLAELLRRRQAGQAQPATYPASFGQQRLWFLDRFAPGSPVYHVPVGLRLTGLLRVDILRQSLDRIVARHAVLRTTLAEDAEGRPTQVVAPPAPADLTVDDVGAVPDGERLTEALRRARQEATRPFDLGRGPLFRTRLIRLAEDDHILVLNLHHAVCDAWSVNRLLDEFCACYPAFLGGSEPDLPDLPIQYADFAVWQRDRSTGRDVARQVDYWLDRLAGAPALLSLPTDRPRPAISSQRGALYDVELPSTLTAAIRGLGRSLGATTFMIVLAAFQGLLSRYSGQTDVVVGTPVADRAHAETSHLIGFFVNTLAIRVSLADRPSFRDLVAQVREEVLTAMENAEAPFERLVEVLRPERSMSYGPIFQAQLIMISTPKRTPALPGVALSRVPLTTDTAKVDLSLSVDDRDQRQRMVFEYATDLFDEETIARFARHLIALLTAVTGDPGLPVTEIPLLSAAERQQVLVDWNDTRHQLPPVRNLAELVSGRLAATDPAAPSVVADDASLTYGELADRCRNLAHRLRAHGAGPDVPVGLFLGRSAAMVTAIHGVWQAGAGYLPLDPAWPDGRIRTVLADARPPLVITCPALAERIGPLAAEHSAVLCVRDDARGVLDDGRGVLHDARAAEPFTPVGRQPGGDDLAYLLYTSGSTGRPKGVMVPQRAVLNLLLAYEDRLRLTAADRWAAVTAPTFDISVVELVVPLLCGATLVVVDAAEAADGIALRRRLEATETTVLQATPATWRMLAIAGGVPDGVRLRLTGGEALTRDLAGELLTGGATVWNGYGPTETTIYSTTAAVN
jgi:non-ribosomal peptide synthetase component F